MDFPDSIFALSSGRLPSAVAVVRMSGRHTADALRQLTGSVPPPRRLVVAAIRAIDGAILDRGMAVFFPGPESATGEDCAELHLHGGRAVVAAVLEALGTIAGMRQAEAGEFTRRAFLMEKIDLVAAEALADLVSAETEGQRRFAMLTAGGAQSALYAGWRTSILRVRALLEAEMDFSDQDDVPGSVASQAWSEAAALRDAIDGHVAHFRRGEILRDGFRVVILGRPNAGKSSLLNCLAGRDAALVSDEPGTTRDAIEVSLDLIGMKVRVVDTAGVREDPGKVEALGIARARDLASSADLVLELVDLTGAGEAGVGRPHGVPVLVVGSKADLADAADRAVDLTISSRTGSGVSLLLERIGALAASAAGGQGDLLPARYRHVELLRRAAAALSTALAGVSQPLELRAEELRIAGDCLGRIVGSVDVEEVLGAIFSKFCIGK